MRCFTLYNNDRAVAKFEMNYGTITAFHPTVPELLPMQLKQATADAFTLWIQNRAIDLNTFQHRRLASELLGSRDKVTIAMLTHMFSVSDTFTCFQEDEFQMRSSLCKPEEQEQVSDFILISSDTSLHKAVIATPNASTDGSFTKTWKYENGAWWLYKLQPENATRSECEISKALIACGWDAAEYHYVEDTYTRIKSLNFVKENEFFEPYDSFRYSFLDRSDEEKIVYDNIASLGPDFEEAWLKILLADALFMNTDRHMRNYGFIRSAETGEVLRLAPNFDNNQAYMANPGGTYSDAMLKDFFGTYGTDQKTNLSRLEGACTAFPYLKQAVDIAEKYR